MKILLSITLMLGAVATASAQSENPPILTPDLTEGIFQDADGSNSIINAGSLEGHFILREGEGRVEIVEDNGRKILKFSPTALASETETRLPCLVFQKMPADFMDGVTFQARVRPDSGWLLPICDVLSARVSDRGTGMAISYHPESGVVDVSSGEGPSPDNFSDVKFWGIISQPTTKIPADDWTHLAAMYEPTKKQFLLYINGQLAAESETGLELTAMSPDFTIGAYRRGYAYPFRGEMADIAVYDYVRSEAQIQADAEKK